MLKKLAVLTAVFLAAALSCVSLFSASAESSYISGISLAVGEDAQDKLENSGFGKVMMWNLNPGSDESGQVLLGYKTGGTPITGIIVTANSGNTIKDKNNISYSLASNIGVSGGACVYVTTDKNAGDPIVSLDIERCDNQSDEEIYAIAGNGSETVRDINGKPADLGSGSDRYTIYMRVVRSGIVKPFISEVAAVTGSDKGDAVYQAASKGFDYYSEGDLLTSDNKYTVFAYNRTRDSEKAIRGIAALSEGDAKTEKLKIYDIEYRKSSEVIRDKNTSYVLYSTADSKAGNPIIDARVGENAALSDCPMSIWLQGYYSSQTDLTSVYARSEELYSTLEKDNTIYTMLPVALTDPNAKAQTDTTAANSEANAKSVSVSTADSAKGDKSNLIPVYVLVKKEGLSQDSLDLIEAVNKADEEEEKNSGSNVSSVFQDSKNHSFIIIGVVFVILAGAALFIYLRKTKRAKAAAAADSLTAEDENSKNGGEPVKSEEVLRTEKKGAEITDSDKTKDGKDKTGKGIKNLLIILTAIPLLTAALSNTLTADTAIAPPEEEQEWITPRQDADFQITPYSGAKKGDPDYVDISNKNITVTQDAYYSSGLNFGDISGKTPEQKTNGTLTIAGTVRNNTPLRIYNTSNSLKTITLFLDNADIEGAQWCTCAIVQGNAQVNLNVIYKGECKMTGYNFAPFKINGNTNVSFNFIKFDNSSTLTLKSEYSGEDKVCQDGGAVSLAYYNYDDVTKDLFHWQDGINGYIDVSKQSGTLAVTPEGVQKVQNENTLYFAVPSGGESGWSGAELYYNSTASLKNAVFIPMEYTGENAVFKAISIESFKPSTLKIYSVTLNDEQIKAIDAAALVGFRSTGGEGRTVTNIKLSITKAPNTAAGNYLTEAVPLNKLFGKTFFIDSSVNTKTPQNTYKGHWETGNVYINKLAEMTAHKGTYRLTGSAKLSKPFMVLSNFTGKPQTFNIEVDNVKITTDESISPFVVKGNGPTTINIIGSGSSDFEANGTGVFYAASNIKITVNVFKTDSKTEVFMKNSATHLQAVNCGPYSSKVSSSLKTEPADFYSYTSGSITKKEDGTFNLTGGSVFMNPSGVTQTHRNLYWYRQGAAKQGSFDPAYMTQTEPAIKYNSLLTLKGSLTKDSLLLIDTGEKKSSESEFSILLSAVTFTSTTNSSPIIVTGKNDVVINLFYSGKNNLSFSKEVPMVDIRTDNVVNVRVNLIKTEDKAQIKYSGQTAAGLNPVIPHDGLDKKTISDRTAKIIFVETALGKGGNSGSLVVEDGIIFTPEGFTSGTSSTAYIDRMNDAEVHPAKEPYNISAVNGGQMKNPLIFYNTNSEPVEFTLNITDPDALFKADKGTPTIIACGKSAVTVNLVISDKCTISSDNISVLAKNGVDLTVNEKRSGSKGKLSVSGTGVTDGGIYSLNTVGDSSVSNRLTIKLTCTDDAGGWNSGTIPTELRDSSGKTYNEWSITRSRIDDEKESVSYTYNLGNSVPTMFTLKPDFGGGFTFRDYKVKLEATMNGKKILEQTKESDSYPFSSSDNMHYYFSETGFARVAVADGDGNYIWKNYDNVRSAWNAAQSSSDVGLIQLTSSWLLDSRLVLNDDKKVKIDLGGYIIRRNLSGLEDDGEVIKINGGAVLDIVDTCPERSSYIDFKGGGIVGGRSSNGGGNIHIGGGTLNMTGGCIYDGHCNEDGGGIFLDHGDANLKNVVIKNCEAEKSTWVDNEGGAIYVMWEGSHLNLDNCVIDSCKAYDYGGAIMVDEGRIRITDTVIKNCRARDNDGGAINAENDTELYIRGCEITNCSACERGGAIFIDSEDGSWIIDTKITGCSSGDHGGGVYINDDNVYMEDIVITGNSADGEGGGVFVESFDDIDIAGESIIKDNKGKNGRNDLTLDQDAAKAYLYNQGLEGSAYIKICSDDEGGETLTKFPMSKYQFDNYIHASLDGHYLVFDEDSGASEDNRRNSGITASVFADSDGIPVVLIAAFLIIAFIAVVLIKNRKEGEA